MIAIQNYTADIPFTNLPPLFLGIYNVPKHIFV